MPFEIDKTKQKIRLIACISSVVALITFVGVRLVSSVGQAIADSDIVTYKSGGGYIEPNLPEPLEVEEQELADSSEGIAPVMVQSPASLLVGGTTLPSSYDSRSSGYSTRQENQMGEGLCWAYSFTTTAEIFLRRTGMVSSATELSVKHLDYLLAPASLSFSDSSTNPYDDIVYKLSGSHRSLGYGGNIYISLFASSGKYALTGDDTFFSKMKQNDSDIQSYSSYGQLIYNMGYNYIKYSTGSLIYSEKQQSSDVFDEDSAAYGVTGTDSPGTVYYSLDADSTNSSTITAIKNAVYSYGAYAISAHYSENNCMYIDGDNYTIIDRTSSASTVSGSSNACYDDGDTGHGIVIVGWNDDWEYYDGDTLKTGAFIIQNSYGNDGISYYMSYNSYLSGIYITSMVESADYDKIMDLSDYTSIVDADNYSVLFEFPDSSDYTLSDLSVMTTRITAANVISWDVYLKKGDGEFTQIGSSIPEGNYVKLTSFSDLDEDLDGAFTIKLSVNTNGYTITGFTPSFFSQNYTDFLTATAYLTEDTDSGNTTSSNSTSGNTTSGNSTANITVNVESTASVIWSVDATATVSIISGAATSFGDHSVSVISNNNENGYDLIVTGGALTKSSDSIPALSSVSAIAADTSNITTSVWGVQATTTQNSAPKVTDTNWVGPSETGQTLFEGAGVSGKTNIYIYYGVATRMDLPYGAYNGTITLTLQPRAY